jgi:hypothetical protein
MIRKQMIVMGLLLVLMTAGAQNVTTDSSATCVAYWSKGDVKKFLITRSSVKYEAGKETGRTQSTYESVMKVIDSTEKNYTIEWQCKPVKAGSSTDAAELVTHMLDQLKIVYTTSETGGFESLINYEEVKKYIQNATSQVLNAGNQKPEVKKAVQEFMKAFQSREAIESVVLREISAYHSPYGIEYSSRNPQVADAELPNIFGGDPIPAILTLALKKLDEPKDLAVITIDQKIDKEKAGDFLKDMLRKVGAPDSVVNAKGKFETIDIHDIYEYDLNLSDGWIKKAVSKREVRFMDMRKIDICEIKIK